MKNINSYRVFERNTASVQEQGDYVLYWMQIHRRFEYNYALEYAVAWANKLKKPLLIYEGLNLNYPWANARIHHFMLQGMQEHVQEAKKLGINYYPFVEQASGEGKGLIYALASKACCVITDEYPVFIIRSHNEKVAQRLNVPYISVDSNGIIPLGLTEKAPYSAYLMRKTIQKHFIEAYTHPPQQHPLQALQHRLKCVPDAQFCERYPSSESVLTNPAKLVQSLNIDQCVTPIDEHGSRAAGLSQFEHFLSLGLMKYAEERNHPDVQATSKMSSWLHFGKVSEYELVKRTFEAQPKDWDLTQLSYANGQSRGFFKGNPNIESFLDELITWREVGFHFCHHTPNYDAYESLPDWVLSTLETHASDVREYVYSLENFERAKTHDPIWNAAQRQLVREGRIHNYLRMLWGKKVLEWTTHPKEALEILIHLNNKYAIDGRDPNSYSGIFWIFGRFDRPWQERPIFGQLRYMSSASTEKKVQLKQYLRRYGVSLKTSHPDLFG